MGYDVESGRPEIMTWVTLKKGLKEKSLPTNTIWIAREALGMLKHNGMVQDQKD